MSEESQTRTHPLERFPGATKRVTLPMSGIEVVVRKVDVDVVSQGALLTAVRTGTLKAVAEQWLKDAGEFTGETESSRKQPDLEMSDIVQLQRDLDLGVLRNAVVLPAFDELLAMYGGGQQFSDLGLGDDYRALIAAVNDMNPSKDGDGEKHKARVFPVSGGASDPRPRKGVRKATAPRGATAEGDAG